MEIIRDTLNIADGRLINIVDVRDANDNPASVLVIYDNFVNEKEIMKMNLEIEVFDFNIFEFDYNNKVNIEEVIETIKHRN